MTEKVDDDNAEGGTPAPVTQAETSSSAVPAGDLPADLGEQGRKALAAERDARQEAERRNAELAERLEKVERQQARGQVAAAKGLSEAQAAYLTGTTQEELEASADALLAAFPDAERPPAAGEPKRLRPGGAPNAAKPDDMGAVADRLMRGR